MKIAVSGATGLIGTALVRYLSDRGDEVVPLTRECFLRGEVVAGGGDFGKERSEEPSFSAGAGFVPEASLPAEASFPAEASLPAEAPFSAKLAAALEGCDAVVNLAGAPVSRRWSDAYKKELYASRVGVTRQLVAAVNSMKRLPAVFVSASAVGYYPDQGCYPETLSIKGEGFLSDLCAAWEREAHWLSPRVRLAVARLGVVLSPRGGAFAQLTRPQKMGVAARLGEGTQPFSWIDIEDLVRALEFVIRNDAMRGTVNMVAPQQLTNASLTRALAGYYHAPLRFGVPAWLVRTLYGEAAEVLLSGQCAVPEKLTEAGFTFVSGSIERFLGKLHPSEADA